MFQLTKRIIFILRIKFPKMRSRKFIIKKSFSPVQRYATKLRFIALKAEVFKWSKFSHLCIKKDTCFVITYP